MDCQPWQVYRTTALTAAVAQLLLLSNLESAVGQSLLL